jgi:hypothetical protein
MKKVFILLLVLLLAACSPVERKSETAKAETTMRDFFSVLAKRSICRGGDVIRRGTMKSLQGGIPDISPTDYTSLWQRGCEQNGLVCMEVMELSSRGKETNFEFTVTFKMKDGELFELTGCCGETFPEPITEYVIGVQSDGNGKYKVLSLPPYVP